MSADRWESTALFIAGLVDEPDDPDGPGSHEHADAAQLVVKRGPNAGTRFILDRPVTAVGRHPNSDIFLEDATVSRRHVEFHCGEGEFRVVDVDSLNGTYLNRQPVRSAVLAHGDEIRIGNFRLMFLAPRLS